MKLLTPDKTVLIVGLGMIGGSIARGLHGLGQGHRILAADADRAQVKKALAAQIIDAGEADPVALASQADLVIVAVPTLAMEGVLTALAGNLKPDAVVTDVASVKGNVVRAARKRLGSLANRFVPGHPIAGSEKSGFEAGDGALFRNRKVILTPGRDADGDAVRLVNDLWRALGAEVVGMSVERHDQVLAATSHLPHLLSYALVDVLVRSEQSEDIFRYAAGGFADFSRLASSDPTMWADIFSANADATIRVLDEYIAHLGSLRDDLVEKRHDRMKQTFTVAKRARDDFIQRIMTPGSRQGATPGKQITYRVEPGGTLKGEIRVPGDKSISHRAIMLGSLATGVTQVTGFLEGEDAMKTLEAFREMGVTVVGPEQGRLEIHGVGMQGLQAPRQALYMGNSGTAIRLLAGLLSGQTFASQLTGDESLSGRPMGRIAEPLRKMGARIETTAGGTPPLSILGSPLRGIDYRMPMSSAQVKSCLLLAALFAQGETRVHQPAVCRDHTERMLRGFGYNLDVDKQSGTVTIEGGQSLTATTVDVPGDISSAAFFLVGASIAPGAHLRLRQVGINPTRTGIIELLQRMGADIRIGNLRESGGEPVADIEVSHAALKGIDVPAELIPLAIDEFPAFFIAAACADGVTTLRGAEELRVKESDRLQAMANGLRTLGIQHKLHPDGIDITGGKLSGGEIMSEGDHRIAMAFSIAGLRCSEPVVIHDCANVATSFPGFVTLSRQAGLNIEMQDPARQGP